MKRTVPRRVGDRPPCACRDGLAPPPDRSWVTTEDIKEGWPSARRPKQWYPGGGDWPRPTRPSPMRPAEGGIGFWFSAALGVVAFAVFVLALWLA